MSVSSSACPASSAVIADATRRRPAQAALGTTEHQDGAVELESVGVTLLIAELWKDLERLGR